MHAHINSIVDIDTTKLHSLDVRPHYVCIFIGFFLRFFFFLLFSFLRLLADMPNFQVH